ncbi:MAG: hypothetical protein KKF44_06785, partial [Nanoarchaeota archaeon]|nr:hypothetical protein [Nanoarchaeota archaeon]
MAKETGQKPVKSILLLLFIVLYSQSAFGAAGISCGTTSPCICGEACSGGNEAGNGYNTIDECMDGNDFTYEYIEDINVTDIDGSTFYGNDTIVVNAYVDCDLDGDGITISYNNGTGWVAVYNDVCEMEELDGKKYVTTSLKLDNTGGTHSIRAVIVYMGEEDLICGYDHDTSYSDTDDVSFTVTALNTDLIYPSVNEVNPTPGTVFFSSGEYALNITVNATDNIGIGSVFANITWGSNSQYLQLDNPDEEDIFYAEFSNTSSITM